MPGWLTDGVPQLGTFSGNETGSFDTNAANGVNPQTGAISVAQLVNLISYYGQTKDKTMVAGSRYFSSVQIGFAQTLTGIQALVGTTGGTDSWIFELHDSAGNLVATTATAGTTAGTASTWQQIAFTTPYAAAAGTYFIAVQSNGTTAKLATLNSVTNPTLTGSATGVFGTGAAITPPTTYTANLGPLAYPYI